VIPTALASLTTLAAETSGVIPTAPAQDGPWWIALIPLFPLIASALCLGYLYFGVKGKLAAWTTLALLLASFGVTLAGFLQWNAGDHSPTVTTVWTWLSASWGDGPGQTFTADIGFYMDGVSWLWMLFVTGLSALICLYASEYMAGDKGYARFFSAFALFVVSMSCLVMGDNLVLLYLGWEGVGLCSYMLIGYYYTKPSAVAAAKKAFIVNRIGDLGLALGLWLTFTTFGTIEFDTLFALVGSGEVPVDAAGEPVTGWVTWGIPALLMLGAFGKSAQFPLYVWLPDAMEGPTPVSALIHAATMVTAGVYAIDRMFPLFAGLDGGMVALQIVGWVGVFTALLAATIGMAQFDIKRIMAYSTVSQLGYMFAGLAFLTTAGASFHVFTHAFFKAILFLACGAVMHGFAGQLDLRRLSGLWSQPGWRITTIAMFIGCLNLAGFPFTAGFFSKDMIIAEAFVTPGKAFLGVVLLLTAGLTAYYTFRVFFRVFAGPPHSEPGEDGDAEAAAAAEHEHELEEAEGHGFHPHPPGWAINLVLILLTVGSLASAAAYFTHKDDHGWVGYLMKHSTADYVSPYAHHGDDGSHSALPGGAVVLPAADAPASAGDHAEGGTIFGRDPHKVMPYIASAVGLIGILVAAFLHGPRGIGGLFIGSRTEAARSRADDLLPYLGPVARWAQHKWYVDELYHWIIVTPLYVASNIFHIIDKLLVDGLVNGAGAAPRAIARAIRPSQSGVLQGYAAGMAGGLALILILVLVLVVG
jgi:NADH-quinone oxidoreductase subunit L